VERAASRSLIHDAGFRNIWLVIRWSSYAEEIEPFRIAPGFPRKVDAEADRMSWAYWGFWRCGFDVFDQKTETWTEALLKALMP